LKTFQAHFTRPTWPIWLSVYYRGITVTTELSIIVELLIFVELSIIVKFSISSNSCRKTVCMVEPTTVFGCRKFHARPWLRIPKTPSIYHQCPYLCLCPRPYAACQLGYVKVECHMINLVCFLPVDCIYCSHRPAHMLAQKRTILLRWMVLTCTEPRHVPLIRSTLDSSDCPNQLHIPYSRSGPQARSPAHPIC
jgi:hypothetical protein